ncbi:hypothetical protein C8Q77DRAFT_1157869 [Trametes polyzona]|nr:hypothetical protein C8Q77DRAFT_1157869 [Trametes polyzona]
MPGKKRTREFEELMRSTKKKTKKALKGRMPPRAITPEPASASHRAPSSIAVSNVNTSAQPSQTAVAAPAPQHAILPDTQDADGSDDEHDRNREARRRKKKLRKVLEIMEHDVVNKKTRERAYTRELLYRYNALLDIIPGLKTDIQYLDEDDIVILGTYLRSWARAVRGDDGGMIRDHVVPYLRMSRIKEFLNAPTDLAKFQRGWQNYYCARMLCPQVSLPRFDADWEAFAEMIMNGPTGDDEEILRGGNFPAFLYDQDQADPLDKRKGLMQSPYFLACFKSLWTGPGSAILINGRRAKTLGKPPIAWKYKLEHVTPRALAYTAVQVRYELTSLVKFETTDIGGYDGYELFDAIVSLFESDPQSPWCKDTLEWWDARVLAHASYKSQATLKRKTRTVADELRAAARKEKRMREATGQAHASRADDGPASRGFAPTASSSSPLSSPGAGPSSVP